MRNLLIIDENCSTEIHHKINFSIDYKRYIDYFSEKSDLVNVYYYIHGDVGNTDGRTKFINMLILNGFTVRNGYVYSPMILDIVKKQNDFDRIIFLSDNIELEPLFEYLRGIGKEIYLIGTGTVTPLNLINASDKYIEIQSIREEIERSNHNSSTGDEEAN